MQVGPVCLSRIVYSLGSQLINNSLSCPSAGAGGDGLNFPVFFFFACSQPLAAFHPRSSSRCCAASSRRSTHSSGASWGSHCWVRAGMLGERARSSWVTVLQASGFSWHSHTKCSWRSCAPLDEARIALDQECSELLELGSPGSEFEAVQCKRGAQNVT